MRIAAILFNNLYTVVRRAVVEDDDLKVLIGLVQHTVYALLQIGCMIVVGDDDAYSGRHINKDY
jgi:hypothetical protein